MKKPTVDLAPGFLLQCRVKGIEAPVREFKFHESRGWKFDYAWPDLRIALEVEGVVYQKGGQLGGRHVHASGFREDTHKYGEAFRLGWTLLRVLPEQLSSGLAAEWLACRMLGAPMSPLQALQLHASRPAPRRRVLKMTPKRPEVQP